MLGRSGAARGDWVGGWVVVAVGLSAARTEKELAERRTPPNGIERAPQLLGVCGHGWVRVLATVQG